MSHLVISNLLCFLSSQYDKADEESIFSTISEFYSFEESIEAKQLLVNECDKLGLLNLIDELRKPRQNGVENRKVVNDILDIWNVIEYQTAGQTLSTFVAVDPNRLPPSDNLSKSHHLIISIISDLQKQVAHIATIFTQSSQNVFAGTASPSLHSESAPWTLSSTIPELGAEAEMVPEAKVVDAEVEEKVVDYEVFD